MSTLAIVTDINSLEKVSKFNLFIILLVKIVIKKLFIHMYPNV